MTHPPRIAQIGCGHWGRNLARNFAQLGELAAISDPDEANASAVAEANGVPIRSVEDLLSDPAIVAVSIATPAVTHADVALRALAAGKHVFVEKPLALNPADGRALIDAARSAERVLMVGHLLQYHAGFAAVKARCLAGDIGTLRYIYSNRLSLGQFRTEENVLWSFAPHDLSMILSLAGAAPEHVTAQGAAFLTPGVADWCTCQMLFASGVAAHVTTSWLHPFKEHRLVVVGSEGTMVFEDSVPDWSRKVAIYRHGVQQGPRGPVAVKAEAEYLPVEPMEPLRAECEHFIEAIGSGAAPRTDGAEGLRVLEVLDAAETALRRAMNR
jgi:predicted dehydrogenase